MYVRSISHYVTTLLEEVRRIRKQELFYRKIKGHTLEQMTAHTDRKYRLIAIHAQLQKMQKDE